MQARLPNEPTFQPAPPLEPYRPQQTLLIVDDEEGLRQSLQFVFKHDYQVLLAGDGPGAIELARQSRIDAAVLDIRMLNMSGIELLEQLKAIDPAIEVIMLTAYESLETVRQAWHLGACEFLNKPLDVAAMRSAVARAMERRVLAEEIGARIRKLESLKVQMRQQQVQLEMLQTQGEIYASVLHDINSPLTVILGFITLIDRRIAEATRLEGEALATIRDRLARISRQVKNCLEISRRYVQFLRPCPTEEAAVPVNQLLADLGHLLSVHPASRAHQVFIRPLPVEVHVRMNGAELMQILLNLAINACQCSPQPHQVHIHGQLLTDPLDLSQLPQGPHDRWINGDGLRNTAPLLALAVEDDGPGIPMAVLSRIFDPFFSTKGSRGGAGLGLAIVLRLVKQVSGAIHLHSQPGLGARFTLYLPAWDTVPASQGH